MVVRAEKKRAPAAPLMERMADAFLCFLLGPYLLFTGFEGYASLTEWKFLAYLVIGGGTLAVSLLLRGELALVGAAPAKRPWQAAEGLAMGYWIFSALSALCSADRLTAFWGGPRREGLLTLTLYCGGFLLLSRYGRPRPRHLCIFAAAVSLDCLLAAFQLAGWNPLALYPEGMNYYDANRLYSGEFLGTLGNADIRAAVLTIAVPVFWTALVKLRGRRRFWLLLPLALSLGTLLRSFVAGGVLGVFGGALLSLPALAADKRRRRLLAAGVLCLLLASFPIVYLWGGQMGGFFYETSELLHGRWDDAFGSGRLYIWRSVWPLVSERPWLGGGPDTLGLRTDAAFTRWSEELGVTLRAAVDSAHNEYLGILINQGLPALACFLGLLGLLALQWARTAHRDPLAALCGGAALCCCIQAFFGVSSPISTPYLWTVLGLLCTDMPNTSTIQSLNSHQKGAFTP